MVLTICGFEPLTLVVLSSMLSDANPTETYERVGERENKCSEELLGLISANERRVREREKEGEREREREREREGVN